MFLKQIFILYKSNHNSRLNVKLWFDLYLTLAWSHINAFRKVDQYRVLQSPTPTNIRRSDSAAMGHKCSRESRNTSFSLWPNILNHRSNFILSPATYQAPRCVIKRVSDFHCLSANVALELRGGPRNRVSVREGTDSQYKRSIVRKCLQS